MTSGILKRAIQEAESSHYYPFRVGAVIFRGNRILSSGKNGVRSNSIHPKYKKFTESIHAEQAALLGLDWNTLKGCSILVIRLNESGNMSLAKPCEMCQKLLSYVGIRKVYYSDKDGTITLKKYKEE